MKGNCIISATFRKIRPKLKNYYKRQRNLIEIKGSRCQHYNIYGHTLHVPSTRYSRPEAEVYRCGGITRHPSMSSWKLQ